MLDRNKKILYNIYINFIGNFGGIRMKKILTASLALVMTFSALSLPLSENDFMTENNLGITADAETYGIYSYTVQADGTVKITDCSVNSGTINIPSTINGKKVTSIGKLAFSNCSKLVSITIPDSVTSIESYTFDGCENLTYVYISSSSKLKVINSYVFNECTSLKSITLPNGLANIEDHAFYKCTDLTDIKLPLSLSKIGNYAFGGCSSIKKLTIPNNISYIGNGAFYFCTGLESMSIPYGISRIGTETFYGCHSLASVNIPNSVTIIDESAFGDCFELKNITLPNNLKRIGKYAFIRCKKITDITLPNTLTSIGIMAFAYCESLKSITIPDGVTNIEDMAFAYCSNLESAYFPDSVTSIGDEVFRLCHSLKNFTIPKSVSSIGDSTFWGCSNLICITIPKSIQTIKESAFDNCRNLEVVYYDGSQSDWDAITIAEKGNSYLSSAAVYTTTIKDISSCIISLPSNTQYFRGTRIRPVITVKDNKRVLTKGTDYTVSYFNNLSAGTATIKVTGKGRYQGTVTKDFVIYRRSIKNCDIKLSSDNYYYNDTEISPSVKVYCNGVEMYSGNYKALYCDNQSAGTATIYITGKNNLRGTVKKTFKINPRNIGNCTVELTKNSSNKYQPTVAVKIGSNSVYSGNYTVKYTTSADKKTVKVTLTGKGNLAGTVTKTYTVA